MKLRDKKGRFRKQTTLEKVIELHNQCNLAHWKLQVLINKQLENGNK